MLCCVGAHHAGPTCAVGTLQQLALLCDPGQYLVLAVILQAYGPDGALDLAGGDAHRLADLGQGVVTLWAKRHEP